MGVASDADSTDNKTEFCSAAELLHEQVHTVLVHETQDAVGTFANGLSRTLPLCRNKVDAPDCILGAGTLQKGAEAVHAMNQLEGGGGGQSRRGAEIFLVPIVRERVEGTITMVLGSTDTLHAG